MKKYLLGIDVGTTGTKTLLFCTDGTLLGHAYRPYPTDTPKPGISEQNAEDWWNAVVDTVREVCTDPEVCCHVAGISLSLQGGTMVAVDAYGRPVRPAMVWSDQRCEAQVKRYLQEVGAEETMYQKTGWALGKGLNALQIRWMKDNEPENFSKTHMFLSVPDYISWKLTGIAAVDPSDAGINQLADIRRLAYDPALLAFAGITEAQLPRIVDSGGVIGPLTEEAAETLGLTTDCMLCAGAHDQYAVALGAGACKAGDILIGSGTCWVITAIGDAPDFETGLSQSVAAVPGKWGSLWSLETGGVCLEWWRRLTVDSNGEKLPFDEINREVSRRKAAENGLFFVPFASPVGFTKHFEKATFLGLDLSHDRFHLARAIMEGVAFQIVGMLEFFRTKPSGEGLKLAGGAAKSPVWRQLLADISGLPVKIPEVADLACVGAAILAGVGSGVFRSTAEGYDRLAVTTETVYPDPVQTARLRPLLEEYKVRAAALAAVYGL